MNNENSKINSLINTNIKTFFLKFADNYDWVIKSIDYNLNTYIYEF